MRPKLMIDRLPTPEARSPAITPPSMLSRLCNAFATPSTSALSVSLVVSTIEMFIPTDMNDHPKIIIVKPAAPSMGVFSIIPAPIRVNVER